MSFQEFFQKKLFEKKKQIKNAKILSKNKIRYTGLADIMSKKTKI